MHVTLLVQRLKPMQTNQENWESFGTAHGQWRTCITTRTFGALSVLIRSTSDRSAPTARQMEAISVITNLPQNKHEEVLAIIAEQYDENVEDLDCVFDLAKHSFGTRKTLTKTNLVIQRCAAVGFDTLAGDEAGVFAG